ncbi:branched-chain amino acid transport system II carrier protein [Megasphaera hexanoica]|uniref:Branched-chain amino acid transport system carrier protein n=1 Tax=Megasphaera hexanoica TaxID=1675036 RepID=A0ABW7DLG1_9FIRM|nr:branched-chain amino acid transport system II carrier protein [Megasphaera hexanoica]
MMSGNSSPGNGSIKILDIFILGFAFFATYFGAGNLIFPPQLGLNSGSAVFAGLSGLTLSGIFLPIFTLVVIGLNGDVHAITDHVGKYTYNVLLAALMFVCTFVSIPRTCATAIQLGVQGNVPGAPFIPLVIIYFIICFFFVKDKNNVMDRMGRYLTPLLALILVVVSIMGIVHPLGTPIEPQVAKPFVNAFLGGYNTGDVLVSFIMAAVFISSIKGKGYTTIAQRNKVLIYCGIVAFVLLLIIYGSLLYMGACVSGDYPQSIGRAELLVAIIQRVGTWVMVPMGIAVVLACLTTAIGQVAAVAEFTSTMTGKVSYKKVAIVCSILSALTALLGVDGIVTYVGWIFGVCYPPCLALLVLGVLVKVVPNDGAYKGSVYLVTIYALIESLPGLSGLGFAKAIVAATPLSTFGFGWITPFIIGFVAGALIYKATGHGKAAVRTVGE